VRVVAKIIALAVRSPCGTVGLICGRIRAVAGELLITGSASQSVVFTEEPERQLGV